MKKILTVNEMTKLQLINELRDSLREKYYYNNRQVRIFRKADDIIFSIKTCAVNVSYIRDFINTLDINYINTIFKKNMNIVIQYYKRKPTVKIHELQTF